MIGKNHVVLWALLCSRPCGTQAGLSGIVEDIVGILTRIRNCVGERWGLSEEQMESGDGLDAMWRDTPRVLGDYLDEAASVMEKKELLDLAKKAVAKRNGCDVKEHCGTTECHDLYREIWTNISTISLNGNRPQVNPYDETGEPVPPGYNAPLPDKDNLPAFVRMPKYEPCTAVGRRIFELFAAYLQCRTVNDRNFRQTGWLASGALRDYVQRLEKNTAGSPQDAEDTGNRMKADGCFEAPKCTYDYKCKDTYIGIFGSLQAVYDDGKEPSECVEVNAHKASMWYTPKTAAGAKVYTAMNEYRLCRPLKSADPAVGIYEASTIDNVICLLDLKSENDQQAAISMAEGMRNLGCGQWRQCSNAMCDSAYVGIVNGQLGTDPLVIPVCLHEP